jgi:hypothetical protein
LALDVSLELGAWDLELFGIPDASLRASPTLARDNPSELATIAT